MRHLLDEYKRVSPELPCPKCGGIDWCLIHTSGRKVICQRVAAGGKPRGEAGHLHYLPQGETLKPIKVSKHSEKMYLTPEQVEKFLSFHAGSDNMLKHHAGLLGLPVQSIKAFGVRYDSKAAALIFPMRDAAYKLCGCRFRRGDGRKWSLKGGREGLFLSKGYNPAIATIVTEGPTDGAAAWCAGFRNIIGRPSCTGGTSVMATMLASYKLTPLVIIADPKPQEVDGAIRLANQLPNPCVVITGPTDLREFVTKTNLQRGHKRAILESLEGNEQPLWRDVFRNHPGKFFPFDRSFNMRKAA